MAEVQDGAAAPVVPAAEVVEDKPAPAAEEQKAEGEVQDVPQETTEQAEERRKKKEREHNQRRLQRRTTEAAEARAEAKLLREDRDRLRNQLEEKTKQQGSDGEPQRNDIDPKTGEIYDYEAYLRALAKYDARQETASTLKADREAREGKEQQGRQKEVSEKVAKNWTERETAFQAQTKDYADVVSPFVEEDLSGLSFQARNAIVESEVGPGLLYHLANHPEVMERIADLSPARQVLELGKLEDKLPVAKKSTSAPAPITPVSGGKTSSKDKTKMSQKEYEATRKAEGARWAQ